MPNIEVT